MTDALPLTSLQAAAGATARRGGRPAALAVVCMLLFLTFLDNTVVSVTLAEVQSDLHAGVSSLQWVVNAYALVFASVMLAAGAIGDELGRKKVMLSGAGVFCAGSITCALAPSVGVLVAGRAVMGLGAAGSEPGTLSMIRHVYPDQRGRARAIGVWAAVSGLALALGPVIGGALVGVGGWRWIFWFNLIFGAATLAVATVVLPESFDPQAHRVDTAGALLGAAALAAGVFGIIHGESAGFTSVSVLALFAVAGVASAAFVARERRASHPLLDLRYLRLPAFTTANGVAFAAYFGTFAIFFFTALYLQVVVGYSGYRIAVLFLPMTAAMVAASVLTGRWADLRAARWLITGGCALFGAGLLLTDATLSANPNYAVLTASLTVAGIGIGVTIVPITASVLSAVPPERSGMAASVTNTSREIGAVAGVAVLGAIVNSRLTADLTDRLRHLGIPGTFQGIVINAVEHGGLPSSGNSAGAGGSAAAGNESLVQQVIHAAYDAFYAGLHAALLVSAGLVLAAGLAAALTLRHSGPPP